MTEKEFDLSKFFFGMKGKVSGVWHPLISSDFEDRTITIQDGYDTIVCFGDIEELEKWVKPS